MGGVFVKDEDTHTLRLTSELVDLRVEYANPRTLRCSVRDRPTVKINKRSEKTDRLFIGAEGGIRTLVCFWHKLISSQPRYDRFDTSAYKKHIKFYGILIENCQLTSRKSSLQIPKKQGFSRVYMNRIVTKPSFFRVSPVMTTSIPLHNMMQ